MSEKYKGKAVFAKLNTDQAPNLAMRYGILTIPQFLMFFHGKMGCRFNGPDAKKLEELIEKSIRKT
jgi:thioredoxin 1